MYFVDWYVVLHGIDVMDYLYMYILHWYVICSGLNWCDVRTRQLRSSSLLQMTPSALILGECVSLVPGSYTAQRH